MKYKFFKILKINEYSEEIEIKYCRKSGEETVDYTDENGDKKTRVFTKYQEVEVRSYDSTLKTKTKDLSNDTVKEITREEFEEIISLAMKKKDERIQSAHREFMKYSEELNEMSLLAKLLIGLEAQKEESEEPAKESKEK